MKERILRISLALIILPIMAGIAWDFDYKGLTLGLTLGSFVCLGYLLILYLDRNLSEELSNQKDDLKYPYPRPVTRKELERRKAKVLTYNFNSGN